MAGSMPSGSSNSSSDEQQKTQTFAFIAMTCLFFFWGFIAASNGVFIPFCKSYFQIDQFQSQLVDFAFYRFFQQYR